MKGIVMFLMFITTQPVIAQNWQEWTQQNKTQLTYLRQQIAGLMVYLDYTQKGYQIAQTGLTTIGKIKSVDFGLHEDFFHSLQAVNPRIASFSKVTTAMARGLQVDQQVKRTLYNIKASGQFTPEEVQVFTTECKGLLSQCTDTLDELVKLLTNGWYALHDDGRLTRVEQACQAMETHYGFCVKQCSSINRLAAYRMAQQVDINYSKKINK